MTYSRNIFAIIFIFGILAAPWTTVAQEGAGKKQWFVPDFVPLQFAGNIGWISAGAGYIPGKGKYQVGLMYGYVPSRIGLTPIHTVTAKNVFHVKNFQLHDQHAIIPYLGLGLMVEVGGIAFLKLPEDYPPRYYFPKALHLTIFGGVKYQRLFDQQRKLNGLELFIESGTIDAYLWYMLRSKQLSYSDIFSMAVGINFLLPE